MKAKITAFLNGLISYDYMLFGGVLVLFLLLISISIVLRKKIGLSIFIMLLSFIVLFVGPTIGYMKMHEYLFKSTTKLVSKKKLNFTQAVIVKGSLSNESNFYFKSCKITASAYRVTGNKIKDFVYKYKPFKKMTITEYDIDKNRTINFKIIVEPFTYSKDFNISLGATCR